MKSSEANDPISSINWLQFHLSIELQTKTWILFSSMSMISLNMETWKKVIVELNTDISIIWAVSDILVSIFNENM